MKYRLTRFIRRMLFQSKHLHQQAIFSTYIPISVCEKHYFLLQNIDLTQAGDLVLEVRTFRVSLFTNNDTELMPWYYPFVFSSLFSIWLWSSVLYFAFTGKFTIWRAFHSTLCEKSYWSPCLCVSFFKTHANDQKGGGWIPVQNTPWGKDKVIAQLCPLWKLVLLCFAFLALYPYLSFSLLVCLSPSPASPTY